MTRLARNRDTHLTPETAAELVRIEPDPFEADPAHVLVVAGIAVRRTSAAEPPFERLRW